MSLQPRGYSPSQIAAYLDLIALPSQYRPENNPPHDIDYLNTLFAHQISTIPYENLALHYAHDRRLSLDPDHLFNKMIKNGRGGYCMEVSLFFYHVLKSLGFAVYMTGVRIRLRENGVPQGPFVGFRHVVNIVTLPTGARYHVDVAFGGDGATKPLPMPALDAATGLPASACAGSAGSSGASSPNSRSSTGGNDADDGAWPVTRNIGTQELRLVHGAIPDLTDAAQRVWIYQYRNAAGAPWNGYYCFGEQEFVRADFEVMNYFTNMAPESFQRTQMLAVKFLRRRDRGGVDDEEAPEEAPEAAARDGELVYGKVMLVDGVVKRNLGGRTRVVQVCRSEAERVRALERYFGIFLTEEQKDGIKGYVSELREGKVESTG